MFTYITPLCVMTHKVPKTTRPDPIPDHGSGVSPLDPEVGHPEQDHPRTWEVLRNATHGVSMCVIIPGNAPLGITQISHVHTML